MRSKHAARRRVAPIVGAAVVAVGIGACGSGSGSGSGQTSTSTTSTGPGQAAASSAARQKAEAAIEPLVGQPSAFPVTTPLKRLPRGASITYVDCGTPACGLFGQLIPPAAEAAGVKLETIKAGASAQGVNDALSSVIETKPDAVIIPGLEPATYRENLRKLKEAGIHVVTIATVTGKPLGVDVEILGRRFWDRTTRLQADWVYAHDGDKAGVAFVSAPELAFSAQAREAFTAELASLCPDCTVRDVSIPVQTIGSTAPQKIVSDLQAHPSTTTVVAPTSEIFNGLPAALKTAGIDVQVVGGGGGPLNLQYLKDGQQTVDLAGDFPVISWMTVDAALRLIAGEPVPDEVADGVPDQQFLLPDDIVFDPQKGWTGYPDFPQRFMKLWGAGAP
jgi:ribose transport system substrate-binding protein